MKERINTNPHLLHFILKRHKNFPNNELPVLIYKKTLRLPLQKNKAADIIQHLLLHNGWSNSWRNGIYDFHHYHSNTHECIVIAMGSAIIILGGPGGKKIKLAQGDVLILPAGVGHKCVSYTKNFFCVGAYPQGKDYDINTGTPEEYKIALPRIRKLAVPLRDPVFGRSGFLEGYWK